MSIYRDRQVRQYFMFLAACVSFLFLSGIVIYWKQADAARYLFLEHSGAIAASLLEQGISEDVIANAITNTSSTETGMELIKRIGISEHTSVLFIPFIDQMQQQTAFILIISNSVLSMLLLVGAFFFFRKRKQLYWEAKQIILRYIEGDFSCHLPRVDEGAVYQLFTCIDQLATILQSRNDTQKKTKEFLKNTIADISHQLKTPLAALSMYQEIISDEPDHANMVKEYSQKTGLAIKRMEQLIQSMLKITRLDAGSIEFEKKKLTIRDLINCSIRDLVTRAENEGKKIFMEGVADEMIICDAAWTSEAIGNIVKNALDYTEEGGEILLSWERSPAMLRICIFNQGKEIAPEDIHHIFKRFYRSKRSLDTQGVGLGLALAKSIIEGQGGIISVKSSNRTGTVFTLSFLTEL